MKLLVYLEKYHLENLIVILITLSLMGCAAVQPAILEAPVIAPIGPGQVEALQMTSTLVGMARAVQDKAHTIRLISASGEQVLLAWPTSGGWGFQGVNVSTKDIIGKLIYVCKGGNFTSCRSMADLVDDLVLNGWTFVGASKLPPELVAAITSTNGWLRALSGLPVLILPAGAFEIPAQIVAPGRGID